MARKLSVLVFFLLLAYPVYGQFYHTEYRAPGQNWMEIATDHFRVIYPELYQEQAIRSLKILESDYKYAQKLIGGSIRSFPFIINTESDIPNGFVSTNNFRSEFQLAPNIGKSMNPRTGDWLELVLPHELAHVMHFSVNPLSFTSLVGIFSPDMRRSVHSAAPFGVHEGIAVYHESHGPIEGSGRGHYPYFRNQFNTLLDTEREWSMGQLFQRTDFTPPFDRHYIGGYEFTRWLLQTYGNEAMKEAIEFHYKWPFLGFGTALRHTTGYWPRTIYNRFSEEKKETENARLADLEPETDTFSREVNFRANCQRLQRPLWLDHESLIFFARSCNRPTGFYRYNTVNGKVDFVHEVSITSDHQYALSEDRSSLIYSRYHADLLYDNIFQGDLHQLDLKTKQTERITQKKRLNSPAVMNDDIAALQVDANEMSLIKLNYSGEIKRKYSRPYHSTVVQVAPNPFHEGKAAVIGRVKSVQGIWFEDLDETEELFLDDPEIVFENGAVYDVVWHPAEEKFLFVSDFTGIMNLFEYDARSDEVRQLTESSHNAFEASYSPDGNTIAYIGQKKDERKLFLLDLDDALSRTIPRELWTHQPVIDEQLARPLMNRDIELDEDDWEITEYRTGTGWLSPRIWLPTYERQNGHNRIGVRLEGVDQMNQQAWSGETNHLADKFWYSFTYVNKRFYPGFRTELFNEPVFTGFNVGGEFENGDTDQQPASEIITLLQQNRGASLKVPIPLRFESNARFSSLLLEPQYFISQLRFLDPELSSLPVSEFGTRHTIGFRTVLNLNLRQFTRDVQPNSGWALFAEGRYGLNSDEIRIQTGQQPITGNLSQRKGLRAGIITFISPLSRWNQSLRISAETYTQTDVPVFNVQSQFSENFSEIPVIGANNVGILNTRYTIPLVYPDDGGLLLPFYLSNIYLVLFSQTVADLDQPGLMEGSRGLFGAGIRSRFRLSNLSVDIGISIGWEPTRNEVTYYFGSF
ncbi:MAG: PD40 domain-containing protein [Balneolaceae bacterium]|nr:PD40 domain-containing protein [Balneolaceae bacterium]